VPQPDTVDAALVDAGLQSDGEAHWTLVRESKNQGNTVIAGIRLDGDALPDAEVIDVDAHPFEVPDDPVRTTGMRSADLDDPAIRTVLAEHIAGYERRWLDESIPALGGRTPREAAGDPIGREELTRLLASFPVPGPDEIGAMDPDRLRSMPVHRPASSVTSSRTSVPCPTDSRTLDAAASLVAIAASASAGSCVPLPPTSRWPGARTALRKAHTGRPGTRVGLSCSAFVTTPATVCHARHVHLLE
jgi:hypothetical protein